MVTGTNLIVKVPFKLRLTTMQRWSDSTHTETLQDHHPYRTSRCVRDTVRGPDTPIRLDSDRTESWRVSHLPTWDRTSHGPERIDTE